MEWLMILAVTACIGVGTAATFEHNKSGKPVFETPHIPHAENDDTDLNTYKSWTGVDSDTPAFMDVDDAKRWAIRYDTKAARPTIVHHVPYEDAIYCVDGAAGAPPGPVCFSLYDITER